MKREIIALTVLSLMISSLAVMVAACEGEGDSRASFVVEERWATGQVFRIPESVKYDSDNDRIYVANINGRATRKDGNGFISMVTPEGEVMELKWVDGLDAPKGMGIWGGKLYVTNIDEVVEIDISEGKIKERYPAAGARFLNDIDIDSEGNVYISDSSGENSVIYRLKDGEIEVWMKGDKLNRPNGLYVNDSVLVVGNSGEGKLIGVNIDDKSVELIADVGSGIDGIEMDGEGNFIISDWRGKTRLVCPDGTITLLRDTSGEKVNSADIEFMVDENIILIPTFMDNRVVAVELKESSQE